MKLNNKGFAITAVLYGLLILFVFLVSSYLMVLSAKKNKVDNITDEIENEYVSGDDDKVLLIDYIKQLYVSGNPKLITQGTSNDTYYYSYQDAEKTWGLMNDGLKISSTFGAGATVITNTTSLTSGTEGNIRYFGPSDSVNNYIYFNCETYPDTNCELWRIIGIVDGKVKISRNDSIRSLAWDQNRNTDSNSTSYSNSWTDSSLQLMLNSSYYNGDTAGTIAYYSGKEGGSLDNLDMSEIGIKNDVTRNMISTSTWYLGGYSTNSIYPNDIYTYERTNSTSDPQTIYGSNLFTIEANVGLLYASDYGYATDLSKCSYNLKNYYTADVNTGDGVCRDNNWLYERGNGNHRWAITHDSSTYYRVWVMDTGGRIGYGFDVYDRGTSRVHPVVYLDKQLVIKSGGGTSDNPYLIGLN